MILLLLAEIVVAIAPPSLKGGEVVESWAWLSLSCQLFRDPSPLSPSQEIV